jgi:hypothetical protein
MIICDSSNKFWPWDLKMLWDYFFPCYDLSKLTMKLQHIALPLALGWHIYIFFFYSKKLYFLESAFYRFRWVSKTPAVPDSYKRCIRMTYTVTKRDTRCRLRQPCFLGFAWQICLNERRKRRRKRNASGQKETTPAAVVVTKFFYNPFFFQPLFILMWRYVFVE